jgi:lipoprotein-releasing system ATP-binding protein
MSKAILSCENLSKTFHDGKLAVEVLKSIDFTAAAGETIAILGRSGSGKSTLLHLLGGLDTPTEGKVYLGEKNIHELREVERCRLRNQFLGFVYQFHHLLPEFTALENVSIPLLIGAAKMSDAKERAHAILKKVGLEHRTAHRVGELSGGERQRVAIARALVNNPLCLMADEPTGNLDEHTAHEVFELMKQLNQEFSTALIIVTHDLSLAKKMNRVLTMEEGHLTTK